MSHATGPHPDQSGPRRVTPGEISDLLDQLQPGVLSSPAAVLAFFDRKADLLTRIAAEQGTDAARQAAAAARAQAAELRGTEVPR
ncbi:MAG: hypothetical protein ACLQDY_14275 [Streptosporangiaceae bacterium]